MMEPGGRGPQGRDRRDDGPLVPWFGRSALDRVNDAELESLAQRSFHLMEQRPAEVVWEQAVPSSARVWVRADDVIVAGDRLLVTADGKPPVAGIDPPAGAGSWAEVREEPAGRRRWARLGANSRWGGPTVEIRSRSADGSLVMLTDEVAEAIDTITGEHRWRHRVRTVGDRAMWRDWLAVAEVAMLDLGTRPHPTEPVRWVDPVIGGRRWSQLASIDRWPLNPLRSPAPPPTPTTGPPPRADAILVAYQADTIAGVDVDTGAVRWKTSLDRHAGLVDVQATPYEVVAVSWGRQGEYEGWINLSVRNRADGRHRWNRWWSAEQRTRNLVAVCQGVVVTLEGSFLRARQLDDGEVMWSSPTEAVAGMFSDRHPSPRSLPWLNVIEANPRQPWAWLQRRGVGSSLVHGVTGQVAPVEGAIHLSSQGLAVTRVGPMLRAVALPSIDLEVRR
jgi:hypothetical protein